MDVADQAAGSGSHLARLLGFLERDPDNLPLIADAASAALAEGDPEQASGLIGRYAGIAPLPPALVNLQGVVALSENRYEDAAAIFGSLLRGGVGDPGLRFNLAWAKAMLRDYEGASELIDEAVAAASPRAAALKVQALHHLGRLDEALDWGRRLADQRPADTGLMGALAIVALDAEDADLARTYALRAGDAHDGLAALGMLELDQDHVDESLALFDRALAASQNDARAVLGKGLALLVKGDSGQAAELIHRSAGLFGSHLGSWVASGWAYFVNGDQRRAREAFEQALAVDDNFAEAHGGLAVLDVLAGQIESARRRTEIALRLDRNCFSAALAKSLILANQGDAGSAERVLKMALSAPIGPEGKTLAQAMVGFGWGSKGRAGG